MRPAASTRALGARIARGICKPAVGAVLVGTAAVTHAALLPWTIALAAVLNSVRPRRLVVRKDGDLQRQLMLCRRRAEGADVLVVRCSSSRTAKDVADALRVTDGAEVVQSAVAADVVALLHEVGDRAAVERRIAERAGSTALSVGWAAFPSDGVTLEVLVDHAVRARREPTGPPPADRAGPAAELESVADVA